MKVFLTGGTGFIGKHLARTLLDWGWSLTIPTRRPSSADAQTLQEMGASVIEGEIALLERRKGQIFLACLKPLEGYMTPPDPPQRLKECFADGRVIGQPGTR